MHWLQAASDVESNVQTARPSLCNVGLDVPAAYSPQCITFGLKKKEEEKKKEKEKEKQSKSAKQNIFFQKCMCETSSI